MRIGPTILFSLHGLLLLGCGGEATPPPAQSTATAEVVNTEPKTEAIPKAVEKAATTEDGMDALEALEAEVQ